VPCQDAKQEWLDAGVKKIESMWAGQALPVSQDGFSIIWVWVKIKGLGNHSLNPINHPNIGVSNFRFSLGLTIQILGYPILTKTHFGVSEYGENSSPKLPF